MPRKSHFQNIGGFASRQRERRRKEALERQSERNNFTNEQQIARLDRRNLVAARERKRLSEKNN